MSLTTITTPKKCIDLDAAVCSGAPLLGAGVIGILASGPARLALVPLGGGEGKVADLSIAAVQELALLSKDVAVVRDGDHALWALTDPFGALRVKQIARDVRALCMRPSGESAVALHLDGSATALSLSRQEVGTRTLAVRGTLRACDVGDSVTYVVIDGEGGGQLRIHPGATPELGTSARTTLPRESAELDRLRGGAALSVLWRRGAPALCVVTGSPSKLAARMVLLDGKPSDVAVLEDTLLVAFIDGRVALYDAAAVERAGDAPLTATSQVTLAARGKPRILLATAKGTPTLWIGTTAGEVLSASLVREAAVEAVAVAEAPVEVAAPPVETKPVEAAAAAEVDAVQVADLAAARQALVEAEAAREAAEERARLLAATAAEERAQLVAGHAAALEEHQAANAVALAALAHARVRESAEKEEAWEAHRAELTEGLRGAEAAREAVRVELAAAQAAAAESEATGRAQAAAAEAQHAAAIEAVRGEGARAIEAQAAAYQAQAAAHVQAIEEQKAAIEAQATAHAQAIEEQKAAHAQVIEEQAATHAQVISAQMSAHGQAIAAQRAAQEAQAVVHAQAIEEHKAAHEAQAATHAQVVEQHASAQAVQAAAHTEALAAQKEGHAAAHDAQTAAHTEALEALRSAGAAALEEAQRSAREAIADRDRQLAVAQAEIEASGVRLADAEAARAALRSELDAATAERDRLADELRARTAGELRSQQEQREAADQAALALTEERASVRAELEAVRAVATSAEERASALDADLAARTTALEAAQADVARLSRELAEDALKWGDRRISLEGARETADSVISQVKNVFRKRPRD